jgi:hypothetical protein
MSAKRTRISPRIRIREEDGEVTSRPASNSDGLAPIFLSPFNDLSTVNFLQSDGILYPVMLPSGSALADVAGITALGRPTPGRSDVHRSLSPSTVTPFHDDDALQVSSSFFLDPIEGAAESFSGPLTSRSVIKVDISSNMTRFVYRCPKRHIDDDPTEFNAEGSGFYYYNFATRGWDSVGSFDPLTGDPLKTDQAVTTILNPKTGLPITQRTIITSSVYYMGQFIPPNHYAQRGTGGSDLTGLGFNSAGMGSTKIGTPTSTFLAPGASKYHARTPNTLKMGEFISHPFLLEKIRIEIPIVARRTHSSSSYYDPYNNSFAANDLHCRDMDNYVFFLYRQVRNAQSVALQRGQLTRDSEADVTGSDRYLIASASVCFYNTPTVQRGLYGRRPIAGSDAIKFPFHTPAFKHNFDMSVLDGLTSNPSKVQGFYTGSLVLEMTPEIYAAGLGGSSFFPSTMSNGEDPAVVLARQGWRINYVQHAWTGTAGSKPLGDADVPESADYSGKGSNISGAVPIQFKTYTLTSSLSALTRSYTNLINVDEYYWQDITLSTASIDFDAETDLKKSALNTDPRGQRSVFGPAPSSRTLVAGNASVLPVFTLPVSIGQTPGFIGGASSFALESSRTSPVILLPTDELVLGVDAGIAPFMRDSSSITGSFLKIEPKRATMYLYGSQIVNGERRANVRSAGSRSEAVHFDDVDTPILDEFLLDPLTVTMRGYHAPLLTGSKTDRAVQSFLGFPTNYQFDATMTDWWKYPRQVSLLDDRVDPKDSGVFSRFVLRSDKFGQPAYFLSFPGSIAADTPREVSLPGSKKGGTAFDFYPVTNVFTGSTSVSRNTSLHATSSRPFSDT